MALEPKFVEALGRHDYEAAFEAAERALDAGAEPDDLLTLSCRRAAPGAGFSFDRARLERLRGRRDPWPDYYLGLEAARSSGEVRRAQALLRAAQKAPAARYGWMAAELARLLTREGRYAQAMAAYRRALAWEGRLHWKSYGELAETRLCLGDRRGAFAALALAERAAPGAEKADARAWRGQLELWLGRYARALAALEPAAAAGARWAWGWLGAAQLLLGRPAEGLASAERGVRACPDDDEARIWRAECLLALGRPEEALRALAPDQFTTAFRDCTWVRLGRALAFDALGRRQERERELSALPPSLLARVAARAGLAAGQREGIVLARAALELARGYRRFESYGEPLWLGTSASSASRSAAARRASSAAPRARAASRRRRAA